jgi:NlpC/P60 family putative phage cell wall peptidase
VITGLEVVKAARSWIGTPFHHQGRVHGVGCDCVGLLIGVAHALDLSAFDTTGYARRPDGRMLKDHCDREMTPITRDEIAPGDVALFALTGDPQHLAIFGDYPDGLSIIHAYMRNRKVVENRYDDVWAGRLVQAYRLPGVL